MALNGPIVIVDDDEDEIMLVESALKSISVPNHRLVFKNGKEALQFLEATQEDPFIILSDLSMPVMDGMELRRRINDNPYLKKKATPFIFRSGSVTYESIRDAYHLSVQGFFPKTMSFDDLKDQLKLILDYWKNCFEPNTILK